MWQDGGVKRQSSQTQPIRRRRSPKEKAEVLQAHRRSGLSLLAFARKEGFCYTSLLRWRSRRSKGAQPPVACALEPDPGFVPVKIQSEVVSGEYVLSWPSGRSLKIPQHFERDSLHRLLGLLEEKR